MAAEPPRSQPASFLHSTFRPSSEQKSTRLRGEIYKLSDLDTVLIYKEKESPELINYRVCDFGDKKLFNAVQVLQLPPPEDQEVGLGKTVSRKSSSRESFQYIGRHDSQRQSFQYLVRRFDRNDPLVVKAREGATDPECEIHCSDGNIVGYCASRCSNRNEEYEVLDSTETSLYTLSPPSSSCCGCCAFLKTSSKKTNVYRVELSGEKETLVDISIPRKENDKPIVISFVSDLDEVYKVLFLGTALALDAGALNDLN